jgi:nitroimidazol reductase NimA-like FMN-containing flavoprotein (pyridoxamine 5'-phosphate oxidase superfamily)
MTRDKHRITELDEQQCHDLLTAHAARLGRVAFAEGGDPDWPTVLPVNYAYVDGAVYFRTFEGSKLYAALRHQRVAFEVDAIDAAWHDGWSVVALGSLDVVRDRALMAVVDADLASWAAGSSEQLVRLEIDQLTGRRVIGPSDV